MADVDAKRFDAARCSRARAAGLRKGASDCRMRSDGENGETERGVRTLDTEICERNACAMRGDSSEKERGGVILFRATAM